MPNDSNFWTRSITVAAWTGILRKGTPTMRISSGNGLPGVGNERRYCAENRSNSQFLPFPPSLNLSRWLILEPLGLPRDKVWCKDGAERTAGNPQWSRVYQNGDRQEFKEASDGLHRPLVLVRHQREAASPRTWALFPMPPTSYKVNKSG